MRRSADKAEPWVPRPLLVEALARSVEALSLAQPTAALLPVLALLLALPVVCRQSAAFALSQQAHMTLTIG